MGAIRKKQTFAKITIRINNSVKRGKPLKHKGN